MNIEKHLKENFFVYLKERGYREFTPSGKPSTVYDYVKRVDKVCKIEKFNWADLMEQIHKAVKDYDMGGIKEAIGKQSHRAVINALKRYQEFVIQLG